MTRVLIACFALLALGGCAFDGQLTNRISVTLAMDECRIDSRWTMPGISVPIDEKDCEAIRQALRLRLWQDVMQAQAAAQQGAKPAPTTGALK